MLVLRMFGPQGTSVQATLMCCLIARLIVGVSGPPSLGPMNHASYFFEISASRSWLICFVVVNCASKTVSFTLPYFFAMSWAPWSSAVQYVFAADARNTATLTVFWLRPDAVAASVAEI